MTKLKKKRRLKKIKIVEKKLGRSGVWGFCYWDKRRGIEIEKKSKGKRRLGIILHELIHKIFGPNLPEYKVLKAERILRDSLWDQKYRRVDQ